MEQYNCSSTSYSTIKLCTTLVHIAATRDYSGDLHRIVTLNTIILYYSNHVYRNNINDRLHKKVPNFSFCIFKKIAFKESQRKKYSHLKIGFG
jgi:hypothetical protein